MPGSKLNMPPCTSTAVSTAPTMIGGEKLNTSFLMGPEISGMLAECALTVMDATETPAAIPASANHVATQAHGSVCRQAMSAATMAVMPITTSPQPDTAV